MSLLKLLNISKQSLLAQQRAIGITANNIANVNTQGYRRQQVNLSDVTSSRAFLGFSKLNGMYTQGEAIHIRERFIEHQINLEYQSRGKYYTDETSLTQIENIFGEPDDSALSNVMEAFWNSWNDLANEPENLSLKGNVKDKGIQLASTFNRIHTDLVEKNNQTANDILQKVGEVNQILDELKSVNEGIASGGSFELLDQRDTLISNLSNLINLDVHEDQNGQLVLSTNGTVLLSGDFQNHLQADVTNTDGVKSVAIKLSEGDHAINITSGEIGSLLETANERIPDYLSRLNELAASISEQVNSIHRSGFNTDGVTGIDFFSADSTDAGNIKVSQDILDDMGLIATSPAADTPGDGSVAQSISDLQSGSIVGGTTVTDFYQALIGHIGHQVQEASSLRSNQDMLVQSLQNQRDAVSGVSLDEEMTRMVEYEKGYQAAARIISTVDDLMNTVLNMI